MQEAHNLRKPIMKRGASIPLIVKYSHVSIADRVSADSMNLYPGGLNHGHISAENVRDRSGISQPAISPVMMKTMMSYMHFHYIFNDNSKTIPIPNVPEAIHSQVFIIYGVFSN